MSAKSVAQSAHKRNALHGLRTRVGDIYRKLAADNVTGDAAMMSFNLLFSILAFLLLLVFIAGTLFHKPSVVNAMLDELDRIFPGTPRGDLNATINGIRDSANRIGVIALIALLWTGSSFWSSIDHALSKIYVVGGRPFVRRRLQGALFTLLLIAFFCLVIVLAGTVGLTAADGKDLPFGLSRIPGLLSYVSLAVTWAIAGSLLAFVYGVGPNTRVGWREIWPGTVFGAGLITALTLIFPAYIATVDVTRYGAAFGFVVLTLSWLYLISLVILLGAEVNSLRHHSHWKS